MLIDVEMGVWAVVMHLGVTCSFLVSMCINICMCGKLFSFFFFFRPVIFVLRTGNDVD